jgi:transposase InsO family protein
LGFLSFGAERVPLSHVSQGQWPNDTLQENQTRLTGADRVRGKIGDEDGDLKMTPENEAATAASASGTGKAGSTSPLKSDPARVARIRAAKMPPITQPVLFDTPEADAICSALAVFPPDNPWNQLVDDWPRHPNSDAIIASIGRDKPFRYNPDMGFVLVPSNQPRVEVKIVGYPGESDAGPFPVPDNIPIEGWPAWQRRNSGKQQTLAEVQRRPDKYEGDRHAIVVDPVNRMLYEFFTFGKTSCTCQAPMGPPRTPPYPLALQALTSRDPDAGTLSPSDAIMPLESASVPLSSVGGVAMADNLDLLNTAVSLLIKAALLAARCSGRVRQRYLNRLASRDVDAKAKEILFLKDRVCQLEMQLSILQKQLTKKGKKPRYEVRERLLILWHIEAFQIPRRKVSRYFGIARSTLYRWLHQIKDQKPSGAAVNKTPAEIASLVWEITKANFSWGRIRIANQLRLLGIFLSASTVRNILQRPKPPNAPTSAAAPKKREEKPEAHSIPAWYPNHVWSVDTTKVRCWELWPIEVLVAIDHFSRKVVCVAPLEGPNSGWIIEALEQAMRKHGAPKYLISDQAPVFVGNAFAELLKQWNIKPRVGAVGKHGSIAVTERVIKTLKYEWLRCVPIIKGFDHLTSLCAEFENWHNVWRPHMTLEGLRPDDLYHSHKLETPKRDAKTVPSNIERHIFAETRLTVYRLKAAA